MGHVIVPRGLQHRQMAGQVGPLIGEGVLQRISHPRLGGQVHDPPHARVRDQGAHLLVVGDVGAHHAKAVAPLEPRGAGRLQARVVIVVEDIDADHRLAPIQQAFGDVHADEAGRAGDQDRRPHQPRPTPM